MDRFQIYAIAFNLADYKEKSVTYIIDRKRILNKK